MLRLDVALALTLATVASAQTYAVLKNFTGGDGWSPWGDLVLTGSTLYGTRCSGGSWAHGVVFSLAGIPVTPPAITKPPLTRTAEAGTAPWFSVGVTNTPPESTSYQWYFTGTNALGNATSAFLQLTNVQPAQAGAYTVVVTNLLGAVTSAPALLSVIPPVNRTDVPAVTLTTSTSWAGWSLSLIYFATAASRDCLRIRSKTERHGQQNQREHRKNTEGQVADGVTQLRHGVRRHDGARAGLLVGQVNHRADAKNDQAQNPATDAKHHG